jgi:pectate lyase
VPPRACFVLLCSLLAAAACDVDVAPFRRAPGPAPGGCPDALVGFATLNGGTTGGGDGARVTVTTSAALEEAAGRQEPLTIELSGTLSFTGQIAVASDKTLVGAGAGAELVGGGLDLTDSHNVIVRNLTIARAAGTDALTLLRSRNVWIDHCDLSSEAAADEGAYDGLIDITRASDGVTVSWTRLHDHRDATLVGHSADNGDEDRGHLTVTYHHDLFQRVSGAAPRVRFGAAHVFNNHYVALTGYGVAATMGADVRVERSVFEGVALPIRTSYVDPEPGRAADVENVYTGSGALQLGEASTWAPPYAYTADAAASVPALVAACAGTRLLSR